MDAHTHTHRSSRLRDLKTFTYTVSTHTNSSVCAVYHTFFLYLTGMKFTGTSGVVCAFYICACGSLCACDIVHLLMYFCTGCLHFLFFFFLNVSVWVEPARFLVPVCVRAHVPPSVSAYACVFVCACVTGTCS